MHSFILHREITASSASFFKANAVAILSVCSNKLPMQDSCMYLLTVCNCNGYSVASVPNNYTVVSDTNSEPG